MSSEDQFHTVVAQEILIYNAALALVRDIRHPYTSDSEAISF